MTDGFANYDSWKCAGPVGDEHPDPPDPHEDCERRLEQLEADNDALTAELGLRDRRIEELETENAALLDENDTLKGIYT